MFVSPLPPVDVPAVSLYGFLFANLTPTDSERIALIDPSTGTEITFAELAANIDAFAGALAARGVTTSTVIGLLCPNTTGFVTAFHGALRAGATVTTINATYTEREITSQLTDAGADWLLTISPLLPQAQAAADAAGIVHERIILLDSGEGAATLATLIAEHRPAPSVSFDPANHVAVLPYSSGTTGLPKGVMLSHTNLVANVIQARSNTDLNAADRVLAVLPFFHIYEMTVLLNLALDRRASLVPI